MKTILNIIWTLFAGIPMAIGSALAGVMFAVTIVGFPIAIASFRLASYALWPFGRTVISQPSAITGIGNTIWLFTAGWILALFHLISAFTLAITIVGIPLAAAELKIVTLALFPFGKAIVPDRQIAQAQAFAY